MAGVIRDRFDRRPGWTGALLPDSGVYYTIAQVNQPAAVEVQMVGVTAIGARFAADGGPIQSVGSRYGCACPVLMREDLKHEIETW